MFPDKSKQESGKVWLWLDVDRGKAINDSYGHTTFDVVLNRVGRELQDQFPNAPKFRAGGEEFAIQLPASDIQKAQDLIAQFPSRVSVIYSAGGKEKRFPVTISAGLGQTIKDADNLAYASKESGRNAITIDNGTEKPYTIKGTPIKDSEVPYVKQQDFRQIIQGIESRLKNDESLTPDLRDQLERTLQAIRSEGGSAPGREASPQGSVQPNRTVEDVVTKENQPSSETSGADRAEVLPADATATEPTTATTTSTARQGEVANAESTGAPVEKGSIEEGAQGGEVERLRVRDDAKDRVVAQQEEVQPQEVTPPETPAIPKDVLSSAKKRVKAILRTKAFPASEKDAQIKKSIRAVAKANKVDYDQLYTAATTKEVAAGPTERRVGVLPEALEGTEEAAAWKLKQEALNATDNYGPIFNKQDRAIITGKTSGSYSQLSDKAQAWISERADVTINDADVATFGTTRDTRHPDDLVQQMRQAPTSKKDFAAYLELRQKRNMTEAALAPEQLSKEMKRLSSELTDNEILNDFAKKYPDEKITPRLASRLRKVLEDGGDASTRIMRWRKAILQDLKATTKASVEAEKGMGWDPVAEISQGMKAPERAAKLGAVMPEPEVGPDGVLYDVDGTPLFQRGKTRKDMEQQDLFAGTELGRTEEERLKALQDAEVKSRLQDRKKAETSDLGQLPLFRGAEIEGTQQQDLFGGAMSREPGTSGTSKGIPLANAERVIAQQKNPDRYMIVDSEKNYPSAIQEAIQSKNAQGEVSAVYHQGKSYFARDMFKTEQQLQEAIQHEDFHRYFSANADARKILTQIYNSLKNNLGREEVMKNYWTKDMPFDPGNASHRLMLISEALAKKAETHVDPNLIKRLYAMVRQWLRERGFVGEWTDNDIDNLITRTFSDGRKWDLADLNGEPAMQIKAWHGSPYKGIKEFDSGKIGTGQGAQSFGHGLYFSDKKDIADYYKGPDGKGSLYEVTIHKGKSPEQYNFLKWDERIPKSQIENLGKAYVNKDPDPVSKKYAEENWNALLYNAGGNPTGEHVYTWLSHMMGLNEKEASEFLLRNGVDGIDYPSGTISGNNKSGGRNYVVFDDKAITVESEVPFQRKRDAEQEELPIVESEKAIRQTADRVMDGQGIEGESAKAVAENLRLTIDNYIFDVLKDKQAFDAATAEIAGSEAAPAKIFSELTNPDKAVTGEGTARFVALVKHWNRLAGEAVDPEKQREYSDLISDLMDGYLRKLTPAAQAIQKMHLLYSGNPEWVLKETKKIKNKLIDAATPDQKTAIEQDVEKLKAGFGGTKRRAPSGLPTSKIDALAQRLNWTEDEIRAMFGLPPDVPIDIKAWKAEMASQGKDWSEATQIKLEGLTEQAIRKALSIPDDIPIDMKKWREGLKSDVAVKQAPLVEDPEVVRKREMNAGPMPEQAAVKGEEQAPLIEDPAVVRKREMNAGPMPEQASVRGEEQAPLVEAEATAPPEPDREFLEKYLGPKLAVKKEYQSWIDKMVRLAKAGALTDEHYRDLAAAKLGIHNFNPETGYKLWKLASDLQKTKNEKDRVSILWDIEEAIRDIAPSTIPDKIRAIINSNFLFNLVTMQRNLIGNQVAAAAEDFSTRIAELADIAISKTTGAPRTVAHKTNIVTDKKTGKQRQANFWEGFFSYPYMDKEGISQGAKAGWRGVQPQGMEDVYNLRGEPFKGSNPISWAYKYMNKAVGAGLTSMDYGTYKAVYDRTVNEMATVKTLNEGMKRSDPGFVKRVVENMNALDEASLKYATEQAKRSTFRNQNPVSDILIAASRALNKVAGIGKDKNRIGLGDLAFWYKQTPGALLYNALEYSPAGILKSLHDLYQISGGGKFTDPQARREFAKSFGRAITGSLGFSGFGYLLYQNGALTTVDENKDARLFKEKQLGESKYAVNMSALERFMSGGFKSNDLKFQKGDVLMSYDWAQPLAFAFNMGVNIARAGGKRKAKVGAESPELTAGDVVQSVGKAGEAIGEGSLAAMNAMYETPVMTGLQRVLGPNYSGNAAEPVAKMLESVPGMFVPGLLMATRKFVDNEMADVRGETYAGRALNRMINRLPIIERGIRGIYRGLPREYKMVGEDTPRTYSDFKNSAVRFSQAFLLPAIIKKYNIDPISEIILKPYEEAGATTQFPKDVTKSGKLKYQMYRYEAEGEKGWVEKDDVAAIRALRKKYPDIKFSKEKSSSEYTLSAQDHSELNRYTYWLATKIYNQVLMDKDGNPKQRILDADPIALEKTLAGVWSDVSKIARLAYMRNKGDPEKYPTIRTAFSSIIKNDRYKPWENAGYKPGALAGENEEVATEEE
jgi:diguanylate cyclase (GGDEF)-like protein